MSPIAGSDRDRGARKNRASAKGAKDDENEPKGKGRRRSRAFGDEPEPIPRSERKKEPAIAGSVAEMDGRWLLNLDVGVTALFAVMTALGFFFDSDAVSLANLAVSTLLFLFSCVVFAIGFFRAASRSRDDQLHMAGLYYLSGSAPDAVRKTFMRLWFAQIAIGIVAVVVTQPPFGVMATFMGVAINSLWASRYGQFAPVES